MMNADSTSSGEGRSCRGSTEHECVMFLSFRGLDTRKGIADHLYIGLVDAALTVPISVFSEAEHLPMSSQFSSQPQVAGSEVSIPILSESYAASKRRLCELVQMTKNRKSAGHVVIPFFHRVEFDRAFCSHEMCFEQREVEAGQQGLRDLSILKGWESEKIANGHQGEFVRIVVKTVLTEIRQGFQVDVPELLVGIDDHMKKIMGLLDTTGTRAIGIYGMGGIGKIIFTFGGFAHRSFLPNIH
ncbi:hypothetical protein EUGRSUZ_C02141 [Eucalyptus grandis]|uniref:Uncharacterized protein n=2 Tax=Eucalyptus grandis TaxID=71139 RepID=A0ACC3LFZ0_EUCGR|nr:hypothetical protein EUGRSUZ_C02141 [Eucalyptus grandis]